MKDAYPYSGLKACIWSDAFGWMCGTVMWTALKKKKDKVYNQLVDNIVQ